MGKGGTVSVLAFLAVMALANTVLAQNLTENQTLLQSSFANAQCKVSFTTSFIGDITGAAPSLNSLGADSAAIRADSSVLSSLAASGNVTAYRNYVSGTFDPELNTISRNVGSAIKAANLTKNVTVSLRRNYNDSVAAYRSCSNQTVRQYALQKLNLFNVSIRTYQNQADGIASKGLNASSLDQMLQNAQAQIITPFANAINSAKNNSQIYAAIDAYCLFDGCKNGTNFHLAARFSLQSLTLQLNYLETDKNVTVSSLAPAQADLSNASAILATVGTKAYANGQGDDIFDNLSAASKAMQQARRQDAFAKEKQMAEKLVANYQKEITNYVATVRKLPSGVNTAALNLTLSQAQGQIIAPLEAAINASTNATQLYGTFQEYCLENSCRNGTNFHLGAKLKLDESQAYLMYLELRANASSYVIVNQTALSSTEAYLDSASSLINAVGASQFTQNQTSQLEADFGNFTVSLKAAFTASRGKLAAADSVNKGSGNGTAANSAGGSVTTRVTTATTRTATTTIPGKVTAINGTGHVTTITTRTTTIVTQEGTRGTSGANITK